MKTMTCKQMGGPCDMAFTGNSADEVIKMQDKNLKDMVAKGDQTHQEAAKAMAGRWKNPIKGMGWYLRTKKAFGVLPENRLLREVCKDQCAILPALRATY